MSEEATMLLQSDLFYNLFTTRDECYDTRIHSHDLPDKDFTLIEKVF